MEHEHDMSLGLEGAGERSRTERALKAANVGGVLGAVVGARAGPVGAGVGAIVGGATGYAIGHMSPETLGGRTDFEDREPIHIEVGAADHEGDDSSDVDTNETDEDETDEPA